MCDYFGVDHGVCDIRSGQTCVCYGLYGWHFQLSHSSQNQFGSCEKAMRKVG